MTEQEIIGVLSATAGTTLISYIILTKKHSFGWPLLFWIISIISWFIYNKANPETALWFTDFDEVGTFIGFSGVILLGLFYALQTIILFELSSEYCDREDSNAFILIPIYILIVGILFIFISSGYLSTSWITIPILIAVALIILGIWHNDFDIENVLLLLPILLAVAAYIYTFPLIVKTSAWLFYVIFFVILFKRSEALDIILDLGPKHKTPHSKTKYDNIVSQIQKIHSQSSPEMKSQESPRMVITFKGKYYSNGMKQINRKIRCSIGESHRYTAYMYDKDLQKSWITTNYPGANLDKGWSLNVNISKE